MRDHKYVKEVKEVPTEEHWAVLVEETMTYDDGYGQGSTSTMRYLDYIVFENEDALRKWIISNDETTYGRKPSYRVIHVKPAVVHKQVSFQIT